MNFQYEGDTNYEQLVWDLTKPGIEDWAKQNLQYLEMPKLAKVDLMTKVEQIKILIEDFDQNLSRNTNENNLF